MLDSTLHTCDRFDLCLASWTHHTSCKGTNHHKHKPTTGTRTSIRHLICFCQDGTGQCILLNKIFFPTFFYTYPRGGEKIYLGLKCCPVLVNEVLLWNSSLHWMNFSRVFGFLNLGFMSMTYVLFSILDSISPRIYDRITYGFRNNLILVIGFSPETFQSYFPPQRPEPVVFLRVPYSVVLSSSSCFILFFQIHKFTFRYSF